jgi:hypothetical protein
MNHIFLIQNFAFTWQRKEKALFLPSPFSVLIVIMEKSHQRDTRK